MLFEVCGVSAWTHSRYQFRWATHNFSERIELFRYVIGYFCIIDQEYEPQKGGKDSEGVGGP